MRDEVHMLVERDPRRPSYFCVTLRDNEGRLLEVVLDHLDVTTANRLMMPMRAAFLAGTRWMRDNYTSHLLSTTPYVTCTLAERTPR